MILKKYSKFFGITIAVLISLLLYLNKDSFVQLQGLGLVGLFLLSVVGNATIILPMPVVLTAFIGGSIFNPFLVTVVISLGATIGELTGYIAGISGRETIDSDKKYEKVKNWMNKNGLWTLFILSAIPNPLFDIAGIIAGAYKISIYKYLLVVFCGKIVKFGIITYIGANSIEIVSKFV